QQEQPGGQEADRAPPPGRRGSVGQRRSPAAIACRIQDVRHIERRVRPASSGRNSPSGPFPSPFRPSGPGLGGTSYAVAGSSSRRRTCLGGRRGRRRDRRRLSGPGGGRNRRGGSTPGGA